MSEDVSISDDYASVTAGDYEFYFGYEKVWCSKCHKEVDYGGDDWEACEDHVTDWCFVVTHKGEEVFRRLGPVLMGDDYTGQGYDEPAEMLLRGMAAFIKFKWT